MPTDYVWTHCTFFVAHMNDNADAKRILLASPPVNCRRQPGHPRITWLSNDHHPTGSETKKNNHLMLPGAADLAQNRLVCRLLSTYGAAQS